jgi:hypothetical protein
LIVLLEEYGALGCDAMQFGESAAFRRNISPQPAASTSKPSKKPV